MVFFELRWNYSPLKEKAVLLPDGLFILLVASRQTATDFLLARKIISAPDAGRSAATGLAAWVWWTKFVASLCFGPHRYKSCLRGKLFSLLMRAAWRVVGLAAWRCGQNLSNRGPETSADIRCRGGSTHPPRGSCWHITLICKKISLQLIPGLVFIPA